MNYPLAEAILSFTGAGRLDRELLAKTHQYAQNVRDIGGAEFRRRLDGVMAVYPPDVTSLQLNLLDSHDTPRIISLAGGDAATVRLSNLILMTLPGAPCIYYGDEVGLEGNEDPDCRRGFPWEQAKQDTALRNSSRASSACVTLTRSCAMAGSRRWPVRVRQWRLGCSAAVAQVARQASKASSWPSTPGMTRLGFALPSLRSRAAR
jgi:hypothetical protein